MSTALLLIVLAPVAVAALLVCFSDLALVPVLVIALIPAGERVVITSPFALQVVDMSGVAAVAIVVLVRVWRNQTPLVIPRAALWLVLLAFVSLASMTQSIDERSSLNQNVQLVAGIMLALAVASAVNSARDRMMVLWAFLIMGAIVCAHTLISTGAVAAVGSNASLLEDRATGIFAQPNNFGCFAAIVLVVGIALAIGDDRALLRWSAIVAALLGLTGVGVALSRGSMLGIALAIVAFAVFLPEFRTRILGGALVVILLVVMAGQLKFGPEAVQVAGARVSTIVTGNENPYDQRPAIWEEAIRQIETRPLLGYGPLTFPLASGADRTSGIKLENSTDFDPDRPVLIGAAHAHNVLLTVGAEIGVIGLFAAFGFTVALGWIIWRAHRSAQHRPNQAALAGIATSLLIFVGQGLVDFTLRDPVLATTLWLYVGLALSFAVVGANPEVRQDPVLHRGRRDHIART